MPDWGSEPIGGPVWAGTREPAAEQQQITLTIVSLERSDEAPVLAWLAVAIAIAGIEFVLHGISIVRDGPELVCRTPHHRRAGRSVSSIEAPSKLGAAIAEFCFNAYSSGLTIPRATGGRLLARAVPQ